MIYEIPTWGTKMRKIANGDGWRIAILIHDLPHQLDLVGGENAEIGVSTGNRDPLLADHDHIEIAILDHFLAYRQQRSQRGT